MIFSQYRVPREAGFLLASGLLVATAGALRGIAADNPLWLDEIWTLELLSGVDRPWQVLSRIHHDNNHYLNSLSLYFVGSGRPWWVYRAGAILAGVLSVVAAGWVARRRGKTTQLTVMTLIGTSYPLIHYGSEARGYAYSVLLALLAYGCLRSYLDQPRWRWAAAFWVTVVLGLLSHLMFMQVFAAAVCWSLIRISKIPGRRPQMLRLLASVHLVPLGAAVLLYAVDVRHLELGGGPEYACGPIALQAASLTAGGPTGGGAAWIAACLLLVGAAGGLSIVARRGDPDEAKFLALVILLPVVQMLAARPQFLFVRYFLLSATFSLLLAGYCLAELLHRGRWSEISFACLLSLFVAGNLVHYANLVQNGRGQYLAALEFMAELEPSGPLTISSDHDHGTGKLVEFYADYLSPPREVIYYDADHWPAEGPQWLVMHQAGELSDDPFQSAYVVEGHSYRRKRIFDTSILSGWRWHCYRQVPTGQ